MYVRSGSNDVDVDNDEKGRRLDDVGDVDDADDTLTVDFDERGLKDDRRCAGTIDGSFTFEDNRGFFLTCG
jgi:hypothetical protein